MVLNKRGQARTIVGIMYFMTIFIVCVAMIVPLKIHIDVARDVANLNCDAEGNSFGVQSTCILLDWVLPYFFGVCVFAALGYIIYRKTAGE